MLTSNKDPICIKETLNSVTSISTVNYVPQPVSNKVHYVQNRLFVSGFPAITTQRDIVAAFRPFGEVIETNIVHSATGPNEKTHYGFVTFQLISSADAVLSVYKRGRKFYINGVNVVIHRALFKPKNKGGIHRAGTFAEDTSTKSGHVVQYIGGERVLAQYNQGMAYFKPLSQLPVPNYDFHKYQYLPTVQPSVKHVQKLPYLCKMSSYPLIQFPSCTQQGSGAMLCNLPGYWCLDPNCKLTK